MAIASDDRQHARPALPYVDGNSSSIRIASVTVSSFGTQFLWSAEMSQASPYLLSLGISQSQVALVLMAGPLSGLFTQPIVGIYGDKNPHRLGRRRPFIIYGGLCALISLSAFAWCKDLAGMVFATGTQGHQRLSALLAVVSFYALDISINIVTVSNKCLIIDVLPSDDQQLANAYASRFSGASAILTMLISFVDLPKLFRTSTSQLQLITCIGGPVFLLSHLAMCLRVHEERFIPDPRNTRPATEDPLRIKTTFMRFWTAWNALEGTIVKPLCWIELWAWLGWFPMIFYSTTWIGETWTRTSGEKVDDEKATRIGTIGLLVHSLFSLLGWSAIPAFVSSYKARKYGRRNDCGKTLVDLWACSQFFFGLLLLLSPFCEESVPLSVLLIGACGLPWAIACWAPFTLLGQALLEKPELRVHVLPAENRFRLLPADEQASPPSGDPSPRHTAIPLQPMREGSKTDEEDTQGLLLVEEIEREGCDQRGEAADPGSQLAGTVLGIHNIFIVLPQFVISFISSIIFHFLELDRQPTPVVEHSESSDRAARSALTSLNVSGIGWVFRLGGLASVVSGVFCWKLGRVINQKISSSS